jgi:putative transposase
MPSKKIKTPLVMDRYFHIYNRGNNKEKIFENEEDYQCFMQKYSELVHPFVKTYAYCLLPNHFHFLIKVEFLDESCAIQKPSHLFRRFFQSYAIWFNIKKNRRGSLFTKYYRRIEISSDEYLKEVLYYIHRNPVKHGISNEYKSYPFSSFRFYSSFENSIVARSETLGWFNNDLIEFMEFHRLYIDKPDNKELFLDEV